jgi:hypothetical protein
MIWPHSHLLLFRAQTGLALGDGRDEVSLLRPDGSRADRFGYIYSPGADRSFCRSVDGSGGWTDCCHVTPGDSNRLLLPDPSVKADSGSGPTPTRAARSVTTVAAARIAPLDTRVVLSGTVTYPSGLLARTIYIQDATGGIKVYLRSGDFPALVLGDRVTVTGWTRDFHGEAEVSVPNPTYITILGAGQLPMPLLVATGELGEVQEGQLTQIVGRVVKFEPRALLLDDGSGPARIYFPEDLPWRRPYVRIGAVWSAVGVGGQYVYEKPYEGGYRLVPRFERDVSDGPLLLPVTGRPN